MQGYTRRRGDRWQARFKAKDIRTGKWVQIDRSFDTQREAETWLRQTTGKYGESVHGAMGATVAVHLDEWFEFASHDWSPTTRRETTYIITAIKERLGATLLPKLSTRAIDSWVVAMRSEGLSSATIDRRFRILKSALKQAVKWEYLQTNPCDNATVPRIKRTRVTPPTHDELEVLLNACNEHSPTLGMFIHLAAATGARRGELCGLKWSDIDLEKATIRIARAIVHGDDGAPQEKSTKTGNVRTVTIGQTTLAALRTYRTERAQLALAVGVRDENGFIFSHAPDGSTPLRPDYVTMTFGRIRHEHALDHVRLHDLRHHHATALLTAGIDLATVAGRLGHADGGRTTLVTYSHYTQPADRVAADVIDDIVMHRTNHR